MGHVEKASNVVTENQLKEIQKEEFIRWIGKKRHPEKKARHVQRPWGL